MQTCIVLQGGFPESGKSLQRVRWFTVICEGTNLLWQNDLPSKRNFVAMNQCISTVQTIKCSFEPVLSIYSLKHWLKTAGKAAKDSKSSKQIDTCFVWLLGSLQLAKNSANGGKSAEIHLHNSSKNMYPSYGSKVLYKLQVPLNGDAIFPIKPDLRVKCIKIAPPSCLVCHVTLASMLTQQLLCENQISRKCFLLIWFSHKS